MRSRTVELGVPLNEDLARRDFSVNAIAVRLADGALEAVPGALEDLAARRLRALHERSFLDDPTRLLRLVRYGARLRFPIEEETRTWAFAAVDGGRARDRQPAPRLGAELRLLLAEPAADRDVRPGGAADRARSCCRASASTRTWSSARSAWRPTTRGPTSSRWRPAASTRPRPSSPSASTSSSSPPASARSPSPRPPAPARSRR